MRFVLALGLITLCASAGAATMHRSKSPARAHQHITVRPRQSITGSPRFSVPGWTDEQTQYWLNNAERGAHEG